MRDFIRWTLMPLLTVAIAAAPASVVPRHDGHGSVDHCQQAQAQQDAGGHHHGGKPACQHADGCQDCATPDCHTSSHCGAAGPVVPPLQPALVATPASDLTPTGVLEFLPSIATAPPTHPPLV